jgi:hypothetical protein
LPPDDPANTRRPSGSTTLRAFADFEPSFASVPSTETRSPCFSESFRQPCFSRTGIAPTRSSVDDLAVGPLASRKSRRGVHPFHLGDDSGDLDGLVGVVFSGKRVMSEVEVFRRPAEKPSE